MAGRYSPADVADQSNADFEADHTRSTYGLMRRYLKESLLTFEGKPLFPERRAHSVKYELSEPE